MTNQRLLIGVVAILAAGCMAFGYALYVRNDELATIHESIGTLSDQVLQTTKAKAASAPVATTDPQEARALIDTCGLIDSQDDLPTADHLRKVAPYLALNGKLADMFDDGYELVDVCVDESQRTPQMLFVATKHLSGFKGVLAFGKMDEADPKVASIGNAPDKLNIVNAAFPSSCVINGLGAAPDSQFLVSCNDSDTAMSHGYVLDFEKKTTVEAYRCGEQQDDVCTVTAKEPFQKNRTYFNEPALKKVQ